MVGVLLGLAYDGGLSQRRHAGVYLQPRDIFLATSFMGPAHSLTENMLLVVALGADTSVFVGSLVLAIVMIALLAHVIDLIPELAFFRFLFNTA